MEGSNPLTMSTKSRQTTYGGSIMDAKMRDNAFGVGCGFLLGFTALGGMLAKFESWLAR